MMPSEPPTTPAPRVSFGVPVYNEETSIRRCLDSLLAQDFADFEVVVCDNASTDRTREVVESYAARDPRIRLFTSERNVGLIQNFNRVVQLTRGEFFRWVGADDWLEPTYASRTVAALDADPGAIVATADLALHDEQGRTRRVEFHGERLESESPARRFARVLWFYTGVVRYEPLYSLMRRDVLRRTAVIRDVANNDLMLIAELSLIGRFTHVPELLFHRTWRPLPDVKLLLERLAGGRSLASSWLARAKVLLSIATRGAISASERARCYAAIARFCSKELMLILIARVQEFRRERLGLTRERLRSLLGRSSA
jgi:glycosyltransferase involved in cell wall biosynthesis